MPTENVYDHSRDTQDFFRVSQVFLEAMKIDRCSIGTYEVKSVSKVNVTLTFYIGFQYPLSILAMS